MKARSMTLAVPEQVDTPSPEIDHVRWLSQLQADLAQTLGGVMLRAAQPVPVGGAPGGTARPLSSPGRIVGWSLLNLGDEAAVVTLWDGRESGGRPLAYVTLAQAQAETRWLAPGGISVTDALFVDIEGDVDGVVYLGAAD